LANDDLAAVQDSRIDAAGLGLGYRGNWNVFIEVIGQTPAATTQTRVPNGLKEHETIDPDVSARESPVAVPDDPAGNLTRTRDVRRPSEADGRWAISVTTWRGDVSKGEPGATNPPGAARIVERYTYDPYGKTVVEQTDPATGEPLGDANTGEPGGRLSASHFGNPFLWTAQRYDAGVGLYHFLFRSYSPRLGRWLQRDPLGYVDGVNLYQYVASMPTRFVDLWGLCTDAGKRLKRLLKAYRDIAKQHKLNRGQPDWDLTDEDIRNLRINLLRYIAQLLRLQEDDLRKALALIEKALKALDDLPDGDEAAKRINKLKKRLAALAASLRFLLGLQGADINDLVVMEQYERALRELLGLTQDHLIGGLPNPVQEMMRKIFETAGAILDFIDRRIKAQLFKINVESLLEGRKARLHRGVPFGPEWLDPPPKRGEPKEVTP